MRLPLRCAGPIVLLALLPLFAAAQIAPQPPLLLQTPTLSRTQIAFAYGGDIWIVPRSGGVAHRLVTGFDLESGPIFSPDGSLVAFTGDYDNNVDVYVVPVTGGIPRRLTYHPGPDVAVGWTPDGKAVLFRSNRASFSDPNQLFTVPITGGFPAELPLSMAQTGTFSPDASHIAYIPNSMWEPFWQGYRGGQATPIWIARLSDSSVVKIPRVNSMDRDPMWIGNNIYFISDRNGPFGLFAYNTQTQKVVQLVNTAGQFDITSAGAGPDAVVYSQFGQVHVYNIARHRQRVVNITVAGDMPQLRPHWQNVAKQIQTAALSPTGERALFAAHGEILTVPAKHGSIRNLTNSPGVMDRDPAWSPDGQWVAYFSDRSGEYDLRIVDQKGLKPARTIHLAQPNAYYGDLQWSPNSQSLVFSDQALNLWTVNLAAGSVPVKVDKDLYEEPSHEFDPAWSPDSRWLAYTKELPSHLHAVFIYSLADHSIHQVTDGMSDCRYPQFDRSGKYLYFTASTNTGLSAGWLDMSSLDHPVTRSVYVAVLRANLPSPLPPQSSEEAAAKASRPSTPPGASPATPPATPPEMRIDFSGILQRTLALPVPPANYVGLAARPDGALFLTSMPSVQQPGPMRLELQRFTLKDRKLTPLASGLSGVMISYNGRKMLLNRHGSWYITTAIKAPPPNAGKIPVDQLQVYVVPRQEWTEMYHDVWRIERGYYYDPNFHGLNIAAAEAEFAHYLPGIASRSDLTLLFQEMLSYLSVGHMFVRGGTQPHMNAEHTGLLGADYRIANDRYQFAKIYSGENWNPRLHAPLTEPGVNVHAGEYLLAVNGRPLTPQDNIYEYFQQTAGKQVTLEVGPNPDGSNAREVVVTPIASEHALRNMDWIEGNRRKVDELSHGQLAYVYLPDTGGGGFTNFNRYFFSQVGKKGAILDERFNHGGDLSDYIIDYLRRTPMSLDITKHGARVIDPQEAIFGPKVMIINQFSGSGGDALPWYFRMAHVGPLVGVRTWGGLVGIGGYPVLMDGGTVTAPRWAIAGLHGHWVVENHGIAPDVTVWQDPAQVRQGHDPQLEAAVKIAMQQLSEHPLPHYVNPPYQNHHPVLPPIPHGSGGN
ncbi:MAG: S41 family peptidase [Terriglobales bacterium]